MSRILAVFGRPSLSTGCARPNSRQGDATRHELPFGWTERGRPLAGRRPVVVSGGSIRGEPKVSRGYPPERPRAGGGFLKRRSPNSGEDCDDSDSDAKNRNCNASNSDAKNRNRDSTDDSNSDNRDRENTQNA